jgi:hypothetical protein
MSTARVGSGEPHRTRRRRLTGRRCGRSGAAAGSASPQPHLRTGCAAIVVGGLQLWDIIALEPVVNAWATAMGDVGEALTTSISVLHTPPGPPFPPALQGVPIVHLAFASVAGEDAAAPLLRASRTAPSPVVDNSWAPADAPRLAEIHLDPPQPVPALGIGRWLGPTTPALAHEVLRLAAAPAAPVAMIELRNLANSAPARDGAMTEVPGPFVLHAVGLANDQDARVAVARPVGRESHRPERRCWRVRNRIR